MITDPFLQEWLTLIAHRHLIDLETLKAILNDANVLLSVAVASRRDRVARIASGHQLPPEELESILADPAALSELEQLLLSREVLAPSAEDPDTNADVPGSESLEDPPWVAPPPPEQGTQKAPEEVQHHLRFRLPARMGEKSARPGPQESRGEEGDKDALGTRKWRSRAVAALVLIAGGIGVGWCIGQATRVRNDEGVLLASLTPRPLKNDTRAAETIGVDQKEVYQVKNDGDFDLVIKSPRGGFATIVVLGGKEHEVWPRREEQSVRVEANKAEEVKSSALRFEPPLGEQRTLLLVVTEHSSTDTIRKFLKENGLRGAGAEEVSEQLKSKLKGEGHPWVAVGRVEIKRVVR